MKLHKLTILCALAMALSLGAFAVTVRAEDDVDVHVSASTTVSSQGGPAGIRKLKDNLQKNEGVRNNLLQQAQNRKEEQGELKEMRKEGREELASTTAMFKRDLKDAKMEIKKKMEARTFEIRKQALVRELQHALSKLDEIVNRIQSRISKAESEGRNMTEPKALLVTALQKLTKAKNDVNTFAVLTASSTVTTGTTTAQVDLAKPRQLGDGAIKSVKEARDALQKVVVSIAHNMGLKLGNGGTGTTTPPVGTTTPPITGTTTPPTTGTTTATTTNP